MVITPRVVGLHLGVAQKTLSGAGLRLGVVATQTVVSRRPPGTIISQSPQPGTQVARGSALSLQVQGVPFTAQKPTAGWCCILTDQTIQGQHPAVCSPWTRRSVRVGVACTTHTRPVPGRNARSLPLWAGTTSRPARRRNCACRPIDGLQATMAIDPVVWAWNGCCFSVR